MKCPGRTLCEDKHTYSLIRSNKKEDEWTTAAISSSIIKNMRCVIPAQTGLSNRKLVSREKHQLQVGGIHSYLETYRTHLYPESIQMDAPNGPQLQLHSRITWGDFFHKPKPGVSLSEILIFWFNKSQDNSGSGMNTL